MRNEFTRRQNRDGDGYDPPKFVIAVAVYSYESGNRHSFVITEDSHSSWIQFPRKRIIRICTDWDFSISREGTGLATEYKIRPLPSKTDRQELKESLQESHR